MVRVLGVLALVAVCNTGEWARGQQGFADDLSGRNYQTSPTSELGPFNTYAPSNGSYPGPNQLNPELMPPGYSGGYPLYQSAYSKFSLNNQRYTTGYRGYVNEFGGYSPYTVNSGWGVPWGGNYVDRYYRGGYAAPCDCQLMPSDVIIESMPGEPHEVLRLPTPAAEPQSFDIEAPPLPQSDELVFPVDDFSA